MPFNLHAQVTLPDTDGVPADAIVNTFNFLSAAATAALGATDVDNVLNAFYNLAVGQVNAIAFYLSTRLSRVAAATQIKVYDVTGHLNGSPGSPLISTFGITLGASAVTGALPDQVALNLRYQAAFGSDIEHGAADASIPTPESHIDTGSPAVHAGFDRPRGRDRGGIYLGVLNQASFTTDAEQAIPLPTFTSDVRIAARTLVNATAAIAPCNWSVWSKRNASFKTITGGYTTAQFATVRRRVEKKNPRTTW